MSHSIQALLHTHTFTQTHTHTKTITPVIENTALPQGTTGRCTQEAVAHPRISLLTPPEEKQSRISVFEKQEQLSRVIPYPPPTTSPPPRRMRCCRRHTTSLAVLASRQRGRLVASSLRCAALCKQASHCQALVPTSGALVSRRLAHRPRVRDRSGGRIRAFALRAMLILRRHSSAAGARNSRNPFPANNFPDRK